MSRRERAKFNKELREIAMILIAYLIIMSILSYFSECFGRGKYVIEYVGAPFTISFTFFF